VNHAGAAARIDRRRCWFRRLGGVVVWPSRLKLTGIKRKRPARKEPTWQACATPAEARYTDINRRVIAEDFSSFDSRPPRPRPKS
jgi:hypothetical protein